MDNLVTLLAFNQHFLLNKAVLNIFWEVFEIFQNNYLAKDHRTAASIIIIFIIIISKLFSLFESFHFAINTTLT